MAEQSTRSNAPETKEIDLGQVFQLVGKAFQRLFGGILKIFVYLKKRIVILSIILFVGFAIGYGLSKIITKKQKIEVIVTPNLESKNYLYEVIDEIEANLVAKDTSFFKSIGFNSTDLRGYEISIEQVASKRSNTEADIEYLELLQKFENTGIISDILRAEILDKSSLNHRITFLYKDRVNGPKFAESVVRYINSNRFFDELVKINKENAQSRIELNNDLIDQIDLIIANYSKKMAEPGTAAGEGRIVLDNEEKLNITGLLALKNDLIRDTERKKIELVERKEAISIINFGKPQQVEKSFLGKKIILLPTLLLAFYFLVEIVLYLNRKAAELKA